MRFWGALLAVAAAGALLSLAPLPTVRSASGVRLLGDTDPHYHVLRAERMAQGAPGAPWRDPALDSPNGADVPWPPLFDGAIVAAGWVAGAETRDELALAAAFVPVLLGVLTILLVGVAGRAIGGPSVGLAAAAVAVPLPALARYMVVGRVDQHVAEVLLATAVVAAFVHGARCERCRAAPLVLGVAIALSFWTWMGSAVALLAPSALVGLAHVFGTEDVVERAGRTLALGAGVAVLLLVATVAAFGAPGALLRTSVLGIGGLHIAMVAGVAAFSGAIAWRARRRGPPGARPLEVALAIAAPAGALLVAWPGLRDGVSQGLVALTASNPWYEDIREFDPALFGGARPVRQEIASLAAAFGVLPATAAFAIPAGLERWRAANDERPGLLFFAGWTCTAFLLAAARNRFFPYLAVPCAIAAVIGARWLAGAITSWLARPGLARPLAAVILAVSLMPAVPTAVALARGQERVPDRWIEAMRWIRDAGPAPDGRTAVAAPWQLGHLVQYYAARPVVASPFGTEAGATALPDWARFLFTTDPAEAEETLLARGVSHLVLLNPSHELVGLKGFSPPGAPLPLEVTRHPWDGERVRPTPRYLELVVSRLYFQDGDGGSGMGIEGAPLLFEGASTSPRHPLHEERVKVFGVVPGARLRIAGAEPAAGITATVRVRTSSGRTFAWRTRRIADASGSATLRVPYATGLNGASVAGECLVTEGAERVSVHVPLHAVETGADVPVALRPDGPRPEVAAVR